MSGPDDLARRVATWMVEVLAEKRGAAVALSGGSTPKRLYTLLASDEFRDRVKWDQVDWFWGDERFVPPDDPASNYHMTNEAMFRHVPAPPGRVHPVPTVGLSPADSAQSYERTLRAFHGSGDLSAPLFDIVLLGLGANGHLASLFPGTDSLMERTAWVAPVTPEGEKTRITMTFPALQSCRHAAFLVAGADKRDVLRAVRGGQSDLPASQFRPGGELRWFTDDAAEGR